MKKFIRYLFLAPILLSTVACGNKTEKEETNTEPEQQNEPATPSENEPAIEPGSLGKIDVVLISGQSNSSPPLSQLGNHISSVVMYICSSLKMPAWAMKQSYKSP